MIIQNQNALPFMEIEDFPALMPMIISFEVVIARDEKTIGDKCPHFASDDGKYDNINTDWWVSGFWPGMLWIM